MKRIIDLNADMGEYAGANQQKAEAALMPLISSCSIACGGHAGDAETMRATARLAKAHGVGAGAHPSYPDRESFGRRSIAIDGGALLKALEQQIETLQIILDQEGLALRHVKPHGALYNDAARNENLAAIIIAAVRKAAPGAAIVGPPESGLERAAGKAQQPFIAEGFIDRLYQADGSLTPRNAPGAIISDIEARARQALTIAKGDALEVAEGVIALDIQTLCIHSDSLRAVETAAAVRRALEAEGFSIQAAQ